jgi:predicted signal transduction protein with EAL and GGDEF domain
LTLESPVGADATLGGDARDAAPSKTLSCSWLSGTGYSSLGYLQQFPIDMLKIDRTFVDAVGTSGGDPVLARAIIALGQALQLDAVAEGIERAEQRDGLRAMGCTLGQGYLFARPMAADDLAAFVREPVRGPSVVEMYAPDRGRRRHASGVPDERS